MSNTASLAGHSLSFFGVVNLSSYRTGESTVASQTNEGTVCSDENSYYMSRSEGEEIVRYSDSDTYQTGGYAPQEPPDKATDKANDSIKRSRFYPFPRDLCFAPEKPLFRKWATGRKVLVEIGVFEGSSGIEFRRNMAPNANLHLIDPFIPDSMNKRLCARPWMARLNLLRSRNGTTRWYRDFSYNVVKNWSQEIDFLFIDGDHTEAGCRRDWLEWSRHVVRGGIVMFHDARYGASNGEHWDGWPGPTKVVNELFRNKNRSEGWEVVDEAGTVVVVRRK